MSSDRRENVEEENAQSVASSIQYFESFSSPSTQGPILQNSSGSQQNGNPNQHRFGHPQHPRMRFPTQQNQQQSSQPFIAASSTAAATTKTCSAKPVTTITSPTITTTTTTSSATVATTSSSIVTSTSATSVAITSSASAATTSSTTAVLPSSATAATTTTSSASVVTTSLTTSVSPSSATAATATTSSVAITSSASAATTSLTTAASSSSAIAATTSTSSASVVTTSLTTAVSPSSAPAAITTTSLASVATTSLKTAVSPPSATAATTTTSSASAATTSLTTAVSPSSATAATTTTSSASVVTASLTTAVSSSSATAATTTTSSASVTTTSLTTAVSLSSATAATTPSASVATTSLTTAASPSSATAATTPTSLTSAARTSSSSTSASTTTGSSATAATQSQQQPLTVTNKKEHTNSFRVLLGIDQGARSVMEITFHLGTTDKKNNETLKDYMQRKKNMSNTQYRMHFNRTFREKIDQDPSCQSFDVSCWLKAIQWACDGLADPSDIDTWVNTPDSLENHLKRIKDYRNNTMHSALEMSDQEFYDKLKDLRNLLVETLELAQVKYSIPDTQMTQIIADLNATINSIRDSPLIKLDLKSYESLPLFNALKKLLETEGLKELTKVLEQLSYVNAASLIIGQDIRLKVDLIFTTLEIVDTGRNKTGKMIDHNNLISYVHQEKLLEDGTSAIKIVLIEGVAGSGKTTLIKRLVTDWNTGKTTGNYSVHELNHYTFIVYMECRSKSFSSLGSLITSLMRQTRMSFQTDHHMKECFIDFPVLFLIDGIDEINAESKKIIEEILSLKNLENITLVCTTRPEKVKDFYQLLPADVSPLHIYIKGIALNSMESFLSKYHEALTKKGVSNKNTDGLINYFKTTGSRLTEHWTLPFNLSLLAVLWAVDPKRVNNITTPVELLHQINQLATEKLLERLNKHETTKNLPFSKLKEKVKQIVRVLCLEALRGLRDDNLSLSDDALQRIEDKCQSLKLPSEEILGAFMVQRNSWSNTGMRNSISHHHKAFQEFQSALYVHGYLFDSMRNVSNRQDVLKAIEDVMSVYDVPDGKSEKILDLTTKVLAKSIPSTGKTVMGVLQRIHDETSEFHSLVKYQNLLTLLMGLLYVYQKDDDEQLVKELIELLERSGISDINEWLTILNNVRCTDTVSKQIAQIPGILEGEVQITDNKVFATINLLKIKGPRSASIKINEDTAKIEGLSDLLNLLSVHKTTINGFEMNSLFRRHTQDIHLQHVLQSVTEMCPFEGERYIGQLTDTMKKDFFTTVNHLYVSIGSSPQAFNKLQQIIKMQNIIELHVCIDGAFPLSLLTPLNGVTYMSVYITDVAETDIDNTCQILKELRPTKGRRSFYRVYFPRLRLMSEEQIITLMKGIEKQMMGSRGIYSSLVLPCKNLHKNISQEQKTNLHQMEMNTLGTHNGIYWGRAYGTSKGSIFDIDSWNHATNDDSNSNSP